MLRVSNSQRKLALVAVVSAGLVASLGVSWALRQRNIRLRNSTFRIGYNNTQLEHFPGPDGKPLGNSVDLLNEAARRSGIKLEWVYSPEGTDAALESGHVDLWPAAGDLPERKGHLYVSAPWSITEFGLVSRDNDPLLWGDQSPGVTLAYIPGTTAESLARRTFPSAKFLLADAASAQLRAVCTGQAKAAVISQNFSQSTLPQECRGVRLHMNDAPGFSVRFGVAASYRCPDAVHAANVLRDQLGAMAKDGTLANTEFQWLDPALPQTRSMFYVLALERSERFVAAAAILLAAILLLAAWLFTERLRAKQNFYQAFNVSPEAMAISTLSEGRYVEVNESFLRSSGYSGEEVIGRTFRELDIWADPDDRVRIVAKLSKEGSVRDVELPFRTKSGDQRVGLHSVSRIEFAGKDCVIISRKDITQLKALESQLRQSQKMEAIGQLSGGIAHDFNNLLGVIIGYSELLEENLEQNGKLFKSAQEIKAAGQRAARLTRQLLAFSRQQVLEPKVLNLNSIVAETEKMLRRVIGEDIELATRLNSDVGQVKADPGQIEQVILNLAVNARDAMPDGGKLIIETANVELDEAYVLQRPPTVPGNYIVLVVSDTGIGMDAATQAHIFEPFFTTKEVGKGTGLGLATVYGVVKQSGGYIWVYSEPGLGTTFKIYLPRVDEPADERRQHPAVSTSGRATETVLVIEDEESLRALARTLLEGAGYTVLEAHGGSEAIKISRQHGKPIHLLLTDMVMPGMSGPEVAKNLISTYPDLKVMYMSGYSNFSRRVVLDSNATFLEKPFTREALLNKVRQVLDLQAQPS